MLFALNVVYAECQEQALYAKCCYAECHLYLMLFMLSVRNKPFMLSVVMLNVIMLNVVAPQSYLFRRNFRAATNIFRS